MDKVVIAGSRTFTNYLVLVQVINQMIEEKWVTEPFHLIWGTASGVDTLAYEVLVEDNNYTHTAFPAEWDNIDVPGAVIKYHRNGEPYNAVAGHQRNTTMAQVADKGIIIWDGVSRGTKDMMKKLDRAGKPYRVFNYYGDEICL